MKLYLDMVKTVLEQGVRKSSGRNVPDTISYFGYFYKHDLADGLPVLTTKEMPFNLMVREVLWYLSGKKSIKDFNLPVWEAWADPETGEVPSAYGYYWRNMPFYNPDFLKDKTYRFGRVDQLQNVIDALKANPFSRRLVVSAWEPNNAWQSPLPPCHDFFVFNYDGKRLNLHLTQRSGDVPIGIPFNLMQYCLLLEIVCNITGLTPGVFAHTIVDAHIYVNQIEPITEQLKREPFELPKLNIKRQLNSIDDIELSDFELIGYKSHDKIKIPVAV